jgi:transketolase
VLSRQDVATLDLDRFGASAPAKVLLRRYGFTVDAVAARARSLWPAAPSR